MTRAELNTIKARMLDEVMDATDDGIDPENLGDLLAIQRYTLGILKQVMAEQIEQAKHAGY